MDTVKNFKKNLEYQKKMFKGNYDSYFDYVKDYNLDQEEIAITKLQKEKENKIIILLDNFNDTLEKLFNIPEVMLKKAISDIGNLNDDFNINEYLNDIDSIIIKKSYNDLQVSIADYKMEIKCMCPYKLNDNMVVLLKESINKTTLKNANNIFSLRKISSLERRSLKERIHKFKEVNSIEDLKEELIKIKITYNESFYINRLNEKIKSKNEINTSIFMNQYKSSLALDIIDEMIKSKILEKDNTKILFFINEKILNYYDNEIMDLIKTYLKNDFLMNFIIVNYMLKEKESFYKKINSILNIKIYEEIKNIKKIDSEAERNIALMNSSIKMIDELIEESVESLNDSINVI